MDGWMDGWMDGRSCFKSIAPSIKGSPHPEVLETIGLLLLQHIQVVVESQSKAGCYMRSNVKPLAYYAESPDPG
jgi:hypothetical protein